MKSFYFSNCYPKYKSRTFEDFFGKESNSSVCSYTGFSVWNGGQKRARDAFPGKPGHIPALNLILLSTLTELNYH